MDDVIIKVIGFLTFFVITITGIENMLGKFGGEAKTPGEVIIILTIVIIVSGIIGEFAIRSDKKKGSTQYNGTQIKYGKKSDEFNWWLATSMMYMFIFMLFMLA